MGELRDLVPKALRTGTVAWLLHRVTGILLIPLVFVHIYYTVYSVYVTGSIPLTKDQLFIFYDATLALGTYHALNGLRVVLAELGLGIRRHLAVARVTFLGGAVVFAYGTNLLWQIFMK